MIDVSPLISPYDGPIHRWFELTRSNYLVVNRALLQSMPIEWQERFVACLDEMKARVDRVGLKCPLEYRVRVVENGRYVEDPIPHYRHAPDLFGVPGAPDLEAP